MPILPREVETVVVGAGVAGLTTALHLARAGREVLVMERGEPFREGSGANAGTLALQNKKLSLLLFYREANREWDRLAADLGGDIGHNRPGGLRLAETDEEIAALRADREGQIALGVETAWLDGNELRARYPWLGEQVRSATFCAEDGYASPLLAGEALLRAVNAAGARVVHPVILVGAADNGRSWRLSTSAGPIYCRHVVIAAGPWAGRLARLFGAHLPVDGHINMLTVTERARPLLDAVVTHIGGRLTMKQFANGTCLVGGGWRGQGDMDRGIKELFYPRLVGNLKLATRVVPPLRQVKAMRHWAGYEAETPDGAPVVGALPGKDRLFVAVPAGAGFTAGALIARAAADAVLGRSLAEVVRDFSPARFVA